MCKSIAMFALLLLCTAGMLTAQSTPSDDAPKLTVTQHGQEVARFSGSGNQTTRDLSLKSGPATFNATLNWEKSDPELQKNEGNFSILLLDSAGRVVETVLATIDHFDGARTIDVPANGTYRLQIVAPGNGEISIEQ